MSRILYASGTQGRQFNLRDWNAGEEFRIVPEGGYFSIKDVDLLGVNGYTEIRFYMHNGIIGMRVDL